MNDDEGHAPAQPDQHDGELLLYDYFKHLTSLSILTLGGVLAIAQAADPADVKRWVIVAVLLFVSAGGLVAFTGAGEIARARSTGTPVGASVQWSRKLGPTLLAVGVGMFLSVFVDSLD